MQINKHCTLTADDYIETEQAEPTSRLMPDHMSRLTEWIGYGTVAGLRARRTYYTVTAEDQETLEANNGDAGCLDWDNPANITEIITDDGVAVVEL